VDVNVKVYVKKVEVPSTCFTLISTGEVVRD